jgi:hypothetical protein
MFHQLCGLGGGLLQVGNDILAILGLLEAGESHLCAWNVLLWVLQVLKQRILVPNDTLLLVGSSVAVAWLGTALAAKQTMKVWTDRVGTTLLYGVALSATGLEQLSTGSTYTGGDGRNILISGRASDIA